MKPRKLIALSAAYGAGGDIVGPALAERLGVPLLDRAIPIRVAEQLQVEPADAAAVEADAPGGTLTRKEFRQETEKLLHAQCASGGGVMVGRAAAVFLRDHPGVLRVRLDGPREARLRQAIAIGGVDEETASRTLDRLDQAQAGYARELYGADLADPSHYHLVIDSTAVDLDTCLTLILAAAGTPTP